MAARLPATSADDIAMIYIRPEIGQEASSWSRKARDQFAACAASPLRGASGEEVER